MINRTKSSSPAPILMELYDKSNKKLLSGADLDGVV